VRGEDGSFMSRVSQAVFPQRPKPPKPKNLPKAETAEGTEDNSQDR
jgi:hypothetical protein